MLPRLFPLLLALAALGTAARAATPTHLARGLTLVDQITAAQAVGVYAGTVDGATVFLNRYGGGWNTPGNGSFIRFFNPFASAYTGTYAANYTECSSLVTHLLKDAYAWNWKLYPIPDPLNAGTTVLRASPSAYLYVSAIKHQIGFAARLTHFLQVQPGDIGARWEIGTETGHAWIVVGVDFNGGKTYPGLNSSSADDPNFVPALAGATYYEMTVLDSSKSGHTADTRLITYRGSTFLSGGVGCGVMGVLVDREGNLLGHTWSLPSSPYWKTVNGVTGVNPAWLAGIASRLEKQALLEVVMGRLPANQNLHLPGL